MACVAGWYYGIEQPAQRRLAEQQRQEEARRAEVARLENARLEAEQARQEQEHQAELKRQAEMARLEAERAEADQARKAAEERAAVVARERDEQARLEAEAAEQARRDAADREHQQQRAEAEQNALDSILREASQSRTIPDLNLELLPIPAGRFAMGSTNGGSDERPVTQVELTRPFWLGKTEVTQAQWEAVMGSNPSKFKGADRPVEQVSYDDALKFCRKLTARERATGRLPSGYVYTLPTDAQWEYACRAGTTGDYSFGNSVDALSRYGNYCDRSNTGGYSWQDKSYDDGHDKTAPVGSYRPNAWGLYDMHGNVWEWCLDWYAAQLSGDTVREPVGPSSGTIRVFRGGGWDNTTTSCRSAFRSRNEPGYRYYDRGFRLALSSVP